MSERRVSACLIVRDSASRIEACLASLRPYVAEVCVYDTGSRDGTLERLDALGALPGAPLVVERGEWRDDFAWARAQSFALASAPWRMYFDDDDLLVGGANLDAVVTAAETEGARAVSVAYDHHDARDGRRSWLWTNRILQRDSGRWEGVVHELWRGLRLEEITLAHPGALHVRHTRREERHGQYLGLVERAAADPERTPRGLMMLGFELLPRDPAGAIGAFRRYLEEHYDAIEGEPNGFRWIVLDQLARASAGMGLSADAARYARERDAYTGALSAAIAAGVIEDVDFWRGVLGRMEELAGGNGGELVLPGPASGRRPAERDRSSLG